MSPQSSMRATAFAILLGIFCVQPFAGAFAGTITFFDLGDTVSVSLSSDLTTRGSTFSCAGEVCTVTLLPPTTPTTASWGNQTILEQSSQDVSDTITLVANVDAGITTILSFTITFTSDTDGGPALPDVNNDIREDGSVQQAIDATIHWQPNAGGGIDDTIFFQSDVVETVPEPGSLALFGIALGGFGLIRRRKAA